MVTLYQPKRENRKKGRPTLKAKRYMNVGRKSAITDEVLAKLEHGFMAGYTDAQACLYANIDPATLTRYCQKNPKFAYRKEALKQMPIMHAKKTIFDSVRTNAQDAKWLLTTNIKAREEFNNNLDVTSNNQQVQGLIMIPQRDELETTSKTNRSTDPD